MTTPSTKRYSVMQNYIDFALLKEDVLHSERETLAENGLSLFENNARTWLMFMEHDIEQIDEPFFKITGDGEIWYYLPFRWDGLDCQVSSGPWGKAWSFRPVAGAWLKISIPEFDSLPYTESLKLPRSVSNQGSGEYNEVAAAIEETILGKFLLDVSARVEKYRLRQAHEESSRKERMRVAILLSLQDHFLRCADSHEVQAYLAKMIGKMPEETNRWQAAAKRRMIELAAEAVKREEAKEADALYAAEEARLKAEADALFHPFTVYRVKYALSPAESSGGNFSTAFATWPPESEDWCDVISKGNCHRAKFGFIISTEQVDIGDQEHPDVELVCEFRVLTSELVPGLTWSTFVTPEDVV